VTTVVRPGHRPKGGRGRAKPPISGVSPTGSPLRARFWPPPISVYVVLSEIDSGTGSAVLPRPGMGPSARSIDPDSPVRIGGPETGNRLPDADSIPCATIGCGKFVEGDSNLTSRTRRRQSRAGKVGRFFFTFFGSAQWRAGTRAPGATKSNRARSHLYLPSTKQFPCGSQESVNLVVR
jgi:hypothetical protein